ncbi:sigma 54-interacting transcriptional regulator [Desulfatitalea alkaliphila]|uniref:Sigma 54-interacting transcriptional regulator n=1 Tax=Desulfatitalea alkaliphila TaxID=2929485 RepID=A0AA41R0W0_9BACT|nr:sigma 54-interacting transcriptional regulator [Desulfatitalea alkaliphila]MCJ8500209.1 sigma 54-interacting transcriptional regulator [Desulfatitalea alkaliphila]
MEYRFIAPEKHHDIVEDFKEAQMQYRRVIDEMPDGYTEFDLAGNITFANQATLTMTRRSREELVGMNYKEFLDQTTIRHVYRAYNRVYTSRLPLKNFTHDILLKNGEKRIVECSISPKVEKGRVVGFRGIWSDITDRKKREKALTDHRSRLEAILGSVEEGIIAVDVHGNLIDVNNETMRLCSIFSEVCTGTPFSQSMVSCSKSCQAVLKATLSSKSTMKECPVYCHRYDRPEQVVHVTGSPLLGLNDEFMGAVLVLRDMTKLVGRETELNAKHRFQDIIGKSKKMQEIYDLLAKLTDLETTVLISGESGTGKELVAKALHYGGKRSCEPFVAVNCSALSESLLESELFGHVKGAYTGAFKNRQGRFQAANNGSILMDEIGDVTPLIQLKLLRVLQEKAYERVGESLSRNVDVRVIASTNKDLKEQVRNGRFREDLYFRLKVVEVVLPPLRERSEDLPLLVEHFCRLFNRKYNKTIKGVANGVLPILMGYPWPGNVRELEHAIEHAFVLSNGNFLTLDQFPSEIREHERTDQHTFADGQRKSPVPAQEILAALKMTDGNKSKAARLLGINRRTIYRRINGVLSSETY